MLHKKKKAGHELNRFEDDSGVAIGEEEGLNREGKALGLGELPISMPMARNWRSSG